MKENNDILLDVKKDLEFYKDAIQTISKEIIDNEVSKYPVFIAHKEVVDLGRPILDAQEFEANWNISASLLEEFVAKDLITDEKLDQFKNAFKNPQTHCCVFVADKLSGNFLFYPF